MKQLNSKQKFNYIKYFGIAIVLLSIFGFTSLCVAFGFDELWKDIDSNGITSINQWVTIICYRLCLYFFPGFFLATFVFDKRYKYISRLCIWLNWTFFIYIFIKVIIEVFALDMVLNIRLFNNLDSVVLLAGYVLTYIKKQKVEFASSDTVLSPKNYN